jgi:hypothetical protein
MWKATVGAALARSHRPSIFPIEATRISNVRIGM